MKICELCPVSCGVERASSRGRCGESDEMRIARYGVHKYEEPLICGENGAGAIFFCGCSLKCVFCQNYSLSRSERGKKISPKELSEIYKKLEDEKVDCIDLVTPSHFAEKIAESFSYYRPSVPVVYNTHAYEKIETLRLIDLYVDIYLPDLKFYSPFISERYTGRKDYFAVASEAVKFMMNSKKTVVDEKGMMKSGVIIRHLVLPQGVSEGKKIVDFFAENAKNGAYLSLMAQYTPFGGADKFPELQRRITKREYENVLNEVYGKGIENCLTQSLKSAGENYIPTWDY